MTYHDSGMEREYDANNVTDRAMIDGRKNDLHLHDYINQYKLKIPADLLARLKLLDTRRRSEKGLVIGSFSGTGKQEGGVDVTKQIGSHLDHTLELINILKNWGEYFPELKSMERDVVEAAMFHDVGKTGPSKISVRKQKSYITLFSLFEKNHSEAKHFREMTVVAAIERHCLPEERKEILAGLAEKPSLQLDALMGDIFSSHLKNSYDILTDWRKSCPEDISNKTIYLATSHHRFGHNFSYELKQEEVDKLLSPNDDLEALSKVAAIIEIADSCEARANRGEKNSLSSVLKTMRKEYNEKITDPKHKKMINEILDRLEEHV